MRTRFFIFLLPFLSLLLFSSEGEPIEWDLAGEPVQISASIEGATTRVTGSSWDDGDAIGVFMTAAGTPLSTSALSQNVEYKTTGANSFEPVNESEAIYFPFDGSGVDFIAYYPYREEIIDFTYPVSLYSQSSQADIDLLYSNNAKGYG